VGYRLPEKSQLQTLRKSLCLLFVLAVAFTGFLQVSHVHSNDSKIAGHECSICAVAHSGVISCAPYQPAPVLVRTFFVAQAPQSRESAEFIFTLHIRPPPIAKA
jgi:hypothetical protein